MEKSSMKERVLLNENEAMFNMHVENVNNNYVRHVADIAITMANFGIGKVTRRILFDAIYKGGEKVYNLLLGKATIPEDETLAQIVLNGIAEKMATIATKAYKITSSTGKIYNGLAISNPILFDWIAIGEDGLVSLDKKREEIIHEECRTYIETLFGIKLFNLQKKVVDSLQEIQNELHRAMTDGKTTLDSTAQFVYFHPGSLFYMRQDDEDGRTIFTAREINFDPMPLTEDSPF